MNVARRRLFTRSLLVELVRIAIGVVGWTAVDIDLWFNWD